MSIAKSHTVALDWQNVVANQTATLTITPGRTLSRIVTRLVNLTADDIETLKIKVGGTVRFDVTGADLAPINAYKGLAVVPGFLTIDFTELFGRDLVDQIVGAWDTVGMKSIIVEAKLAAGLSNPGLTSYLDESAPQVLDKNLSQFAGLVSKIIAIPWAKNVGGRLPIPIPSGQNGTIIKRAHVVHTGNVEQVEVKEDKTTIYDLPSDVAAQIQTEHGRAPQTNIHTVDFVIDGNMRNAWNTANANSTDFNLILSAADNGTLYLEVLDALGNL